MTAPHVNPVDLFDGGAPSMAELSVYWDAYGDFWQTVAGLVILVFVGIALLVARRRKRQDKWLAVTSAALVIGYNSHGVWGAVERVWHLPVIMQMCMFFVAEALLFFFASKARRRYDATIQVDDEGFILRNGRTGGFGAAVWLIALGAGLWVGISEGGWLQFFGRLLLSVAAAAMWQAELAGDRVARVKIKQKTRWKWTWSKLMVEWGILEPDEDDEQDTNQAWLKRKMVAKGEIVHGSASKLRKSLAKRRLKSLTKRATPEILAEVRDQLVLIDQALVLTDPKQAVAEQQAELEQRHAAEVEALRTELAGRQEETEAALEALRAEHLQELAALEAKAEALGEEQQRAAEAAARLEAERERLAAQLEQTRIEPSAQDQDVHTEPERAGNGKAPAPRSNGLLPSGGSVPVPTGTVPVQRPSQRPQAPAGAPVARHETSGSAALAPQVERRQEPQPAPAPKAAGGAKQQLFEAWNHLVISEVIKGTEPTAALVEHGTAHLGIEVDRRTGQNYALQWKKDPNRAQAPAVPPEQGPRGRRLRSVPNE